MRIFVVCHQKVDDLVGFKKDTKYV